MNSQECAKFEFISKNLALFLGLMFTIFLFFSEKSIGAESPIKQLIEAPPSAPGLSLDKRAVYPRVFSPNGDGINDIVYFVIDNPRLSDVSGTIFDVSGKQVSDIVSAPVGILTSDTMMWDGRDSSGNIVPVGVYLFEVSGEGKTINGSVVVVR